MIHKKNLNGQKKFMLCIFAGQPTPAILTRTKNDQFQPVTQPPAHLVSCHL